MTAVEAAVWIAGMVCVTVCVIVIVGAVAGRRTPGKPAAPDFGMRRSEIKRQGQKS